MCEMGVSGHSHGMSDYTGVKKLRRTHRGRIIAGVCSGIGEYIGVDANIVRIVLAVASFFGGLGIAVYAIGWLLMPDEDKETSIVQDLIEKQRQRSESPWGQPVDTGRPPYPAEPHDQPVTPPPADVRTPGRDQP